MKSVKHFTFGETLYAVEQLKHRGRDFSAVTLALTLLVILAWGSFGSVSMYSSFEAVVAPKKLVQPHLTTKSGRVVEVRTEVGEKVEQGEVIIKLDNSDTMASIAAKEQLAASLKQRQESIKARAKRIEDDFSVLKSVERHSKREIAAEAATRMLDLRRSKDRLRRIEELGPAASLSELEASRNEVETNELIASSWRARQEGAGLDRTATRALEAELFSLKQQRHQLASESDAVRNDIATLQRELEAHEVHATVNGRVVRMMPLQPGAFVPAGAEVVEIEPEDGLLVRGTIDGVAGARLASGQTAHFEPEANDGPAIPCKVQQVVRASDTSATTVHCAADGHLEGVKSGDRGTLHVSVRRGSPLRLLLGLL